MVVRSVMTRIKSNCQKVFFQIASIIKLEHANYGRKFLESGEFTLFSSNSMGCSTHYLLNYLVNFASFIQNKSLIK